MADSVHPRVRGEHRRSPTECAYESVHPRVRGEHDPAVLGDEQGDGSSPRARGTHLADGRCGAPSSGSSPRARGTRRWKPESSPSTSVHPRVRGEHGQSAGLPVTISVHPRVRGEHARKAALLGPALDRRFIPACAGNTAPYARRTDRPVHPRVRGEHSSQVTGSKGARYRRFIPACAGNTSEWIRAMAAGQTRRFIPACAGNTRCRHGNVPRLRRVPVHPRVRGEHRLFGSKDSLHRRFIPACAGNTSGSGHVLSSDGSSPRARGTPIFGHDVHHVSTVSVHPRVRGEHWHSSLVLHPLRFIPASPRRPPPRFRRFIPACAGNTRCPAGATGSTTVHPRVRGEHSYEGWLESKKVGSSPRARGTLQIGGWKPPSRRFIPACAGNTTFDRLGERFAAGSSPRARGTLFP